MCPRQSTATSVRHANPEPNETRPSQKPDHGRVSMMYPKPRTVWMRRLENGISILTLRRRIVTSTTLESLTKLIFQMLSAISVRDKTSPCRRKNNSSSENSFAVNLINCPARVTRRAVTSTTRSAIVRGVALMVLPRRRSAHIRTSRQEDHGRHSGRS